VYPGFCSCDTVGTNHPPYPDTCCAVVLASSLKYQVLETSAPFGDTIHAIDVALQIRYPPAPLGFKPRGAVVSKGILAQVVKLVILNEVPIPAN
jgi:hypothetical protein